ncbi:hypothetical protein M422DRAFT_32059 [Sphaerobolus stellatus SS14]|uniref:BSD domain-containing protein n=1 Tax=Sphaerobolus stellatus (strain SS14) TaxID=990650 RepID=A0A0C9V1P4_SPHS4|nr:hypothetical protein M422DRAFT_32059 [Sphaerobolus stellatus SS14]
MNSLDLYEYTVPTPPPEPSSNLEASSSSLESSARTITQPSLNEEVTQVIGQLGKFWGGFRKQSQTALESARKDLGNVVMQAQKELGKLGALPNAPSAAPATSEPETSTENPTVAEDAPEGHSPVQAEASSSSTSSSFLSRLQSSLPPNLTPATLSSTLQRHLPQHLQQGLNLENATADFAQLRTTLAENIQRVQQGTTVQQAEKLAEQYMQKSEALFKEAGEFLKEAVKVIPPEEENDPGVVWDGTDVWPMPATGSKKGKARESEVIFSTTSHGRRVEALIRKLRTKPDGIKANPTSEDIVDSWNKWFMQEVEEKGGFESESWKAKVEATLNGEDGNELIELRNTLVPSELDEETFWTRYFFRVHQIEREEERRKALLEGARQEGDEDDFTWEDDEDEENPTPVVTPESKSVKDSTETSTLKGKNKESLTVPSSRTHSPRESEDSYDVVSSASVSGNVSSTGGSKVKGEDEDSDWE